MVGMFLKDREVQYVAHKDETTNTWRILDTWHEDLTNLGPDDDVEDDSNASLTVNQIRCSHVMGDSGNKTVEVGEAGGTIRNHLKITMLFLVVVLP